MKSAFPLCTWDKILPNPAQSEKKSRKSRMWIFPCSAPCTSESGGPLCHGGSQTWLQYLAVFSSSKLGLASEVFFLRTMGASHRELKGMESLSIPTGNLNPNSGVTKIDSLQLWNSFLFLNWGKKSSRSCNIILRAKVFIVLGNFYLISSLEIWRGLFTSLPCFENKHK